MVAERLAEQDVAAGFLLDGYPRNVEQVAALDAMLGERDIALDAVLVLTADDDAVAERLLGRAAVQGRVDDTEEVIRHRIALYHQTTQPLIDIYRERGILVEVNGMGTIEEVAVNIAEALETFLEARA